MKFKTFLNKFKGDVNVDKVINELVEEDKLKIKEYLPFNTKYGIAKMMASEVCEVRENGQLQIDHLKLTMIEDFLLLNYTNIKREDSFSIEDYDFLKSRGIFDSLANLIRNEGDDYRSLTIYLRNEARVLTEESAVEHSGLNGFVKNAIFNILDSIVKTYQTKEGRASIRGLLKDLNANPELLEAVKSVTELVGLENVKEELLNRLENAKELAKEE